MRRPNLERTVTAAAFWLVVASLLLVGAAPASAQSGSNGQGIPQQVAALEQRVTALNQQVATLNKQMTALSLPSSTVGDQLAVFDRRLTALDERLAGLTLGGKLLRVVDANGVEVGPMISRSDVLRKVDGFWLILGVGPEGFQQSSLLFFNDAFDCTGKSYIADSPDLVRPTMVVGGTAHYSAGSPKNVTVRAYYNVFAGGGSACMPFDREYEQYLTEVATVDLSAFVPPFAVRYDQ